MKVISLKWKSSVLIIKSSFMGFCMFLLFYSFFVFVDYRPWIIFVILGLNGLGWVFFWKFVNRNQYKNVILTGLWITFTGLFLTIVGFILYHNDSLGIPCLVGFISFALCCSVLVGLALSFFVIK